MTPSLAPLFEFIPGSQQWQNTGAVHNAQTFASKYDAAAASLEKKKEPRSNSWVSARTDLAAWHAAFLNPNRNPHRGETMLGPTNAPAAPSVAALGVLEALSECDPLLEELRAASTRPHCRFNIHYEQEEPASILLPHLAVLKHLCQILQLRASAELALGRTDDAASDLNLMFYLTDASHDEPFLISQLVRIALLQITLQPFAEGLHQWSEPQLRAFQERLGRFDFCADLKRTQEAERGLLGDVMIDYVRRAPHRYQLIDSFGAMDGRPGGSAVTAALISAAPNGWFCLEQVNYGRAFDDYVLPAIDVPGRRLSPAASQQAEKRIAALTAHSPSVLVLRHRFFCRLMLPAICRPLQKTAFAQTAADAALLACALERFHRAQGQFPETLDALRPTFIKTLPHDVINGQPLKYRRTEDGCFLLYSVGWNEKDDGGTVALLPNRQGADAPDNRGGAEAPDGDWVWRVP
jgi:hypothetical protein